MKTKKRSTAARFGARYGRKTRQRVAEIEKKLKAWHLCPYCSKPRVKRLSAGIWQCRTCNSKLTGAAYSIT